MAAYSVQYGEATIAFDLAYAPRKTLAISVHPDLSVVVTAPEGSALADVEDKVKKRAAWILRQKRDLERYLPHLPPRQYVSGETHRYLGRQHRLKVVPNGTESVQHSRDYLVVHVADKANTGRIKGLLDEWYLAQAGQVFAERLAACYPKTL